MTTTSSEQIGAPVRVERHDPELVATVAKAREAEIGEVREVSRLEGLQINEDTAFREMMAAKDAEQAAHERYVAAFDTYMRAVKARRTEELNAAE
jgi:hypothetical protein